MENSQFQLFAICDVWAEFIIERRFVGLCFCGGLSNF